MLEEPGPYSSLGWLKASASSVPETVDTSLVRHWALGGGPGILALASSQSA